MGCRARQLPDHMEDLHYARRFAGTEVLTRARDLVMTKTPLQRQRQQLSTRQHNSTTPTEQQTGTCRASWDPPSRTGLTQQGFGLASQGFFDAAVC
jgi:hypothetical protein